MAKYLIINEPSNRWELPETSKVEEVLRDAFSPRAAELRIDVVVDGAPSQLVCMPGYIKAYAVVDVEDRGGTVW